MQQTYIGKLIKFERKARGLSQLEVCEGICNQSVLSRIEQGKTDLQQFHYLLLILDRLALRIDEYFHIIETDNPDYLREVYDQIDSARKQSDYKQLYQIVRNAQKIPAAKKSIKTKQFLLWNEGICMYHFHHKFDDAIQLLEEALHLTKLPGNFLTTTECNILNSIGLIYFYEQQFDEAYRYFNQAMLSLHQNTYSSDIRVHSEVSYNLARVLTLKYELLDSINTCDNAIKNCEKHDSSYLYAELLLQLGINYKQLGNSLLALRYLITTRQHFILKKNNGFIDFINYEINDLRSKHGITDADVQDIVDEIVFNKVSV